MQNCIKLEIVISSIHTERIVELLDKHEVNGYTIIPQVRGKGGQYETDGFGLNNAFTNDYIICICEESFVKKIEEPLREVVTLYGGVVLASDCRWLIH
jgi:nitrogen regulatory protein PII